MKLKIETAFQNCIDNNCIESHFEQYSWVIDHSGKSEFVFTRPNFFPYLIVNNSSQNEVSLLCIDKCLYDDKMTKCDCAVFSGNHIYFIEIKRGFGTFSKANKNKAGKQLLTTITDFYSKIDFGGISISAVICVGYKSPHPCHSSSKSALKYHLKSQFGINLLDGNSIDF
jgi:hypothetical protein